MDFWVVFLTGLTTGGLSCLAVQGGLLATAITRPVSVNSEQGPATTTRAAAKRKRKAARAAQTGVKVARDPWPVVYFLAAKLVAYTILGFLLGALGSVLTITPLVQAGMLFVAGLFMIATAMNMLNVHPVFRYVAIQPPKAFTRLVRNQAKSQQAFAPVMLGLMTVLIPCGTTLAMETLAIGSANALYGALIMFLFVLGTSPTFFVLGFLATQLRGKLQAAFAVIAALLVLGMGILAIDNGLNLADAPFSPSRMVQALLPAREEPTRAVVVDGVQEITVNVVTNGYTPSVLAAEANKPIRLNLDTNNTFSCARAFLIPSLGVQEILPETGRVTVDIPPQPAGQLRFTCAMGMYTGVILVQ